MMKPWLFIIIAVASLLSFTFANNHSSIEHRLVQYLFDGYEKRTRPVHNKSDPIHVVFGLEIMQIIEVNDRLQNIKIKAWVRQRWKNEFLHWNESEWGGIDHFLVEPSMIWLPDIVLHNNADDVFPGGEHKYKTNVMVRSDGTCLWYSPATFTSLCTIDIRYFPFDKQTCSLLFSSWVYDERFIVLHAANFSIITNAYRNSSQWKVLKTTAFTYRKEYKGFPYAYSEMLLLIKILRKPLYYVFNVITPCLVLVINIFIGFYLPPDCGERVSLTITILLAVAVFLQLINDTLPRNSDSIPILAIFYIVIMTESACSLVTTCIVLIIHYWGNETNPPEMPKWVRVIFLDNIARFLKIRQAGINPPKTYTLHNGFERIFSDFGTEIPLLLAGNADKRNSHEDYATSKAGEAAVKSIIREIDKLREDVTHNYPTYDAEQLQNDWRYLAKILDRLFFRLLLFTVVVTSCGILLPIYILNSSDKDTY